MSTWYPSCVVNFRLRFDESFKIVEMAEPGPQSGDPQSTSGPIISPSQVRIDGPITSPSQVADVPSLRPLILQTGKDNLSTIANRVPKTASVELPAYRQAGKFNLEVDWRELPIDPRLIRSAGVEIFFGAVSPEDFASGMTSVDKNGRRRSVLNTLSAGGVPRDELMVLAGVADTWYVNHTPDGSIIKIEGRDLRGVFLDSPINPEIMDKLDLNRPLDDVIADILKGHPAGAYMQIVSSPDDWPDGVIPSVLDKEGLTRVRRKAEGEQTSAQPQGDKVNIWDVITNYCFLVGAIPYFRGRNLVIRPAASCFDQSKPSFDRESAIKTRFDDDGTEFKIRKMIYGRNIQELSFERKYTGVKVPVIEVVSFDTSSSERGEKKLLTQQWPPKDEKLAAMSGVYPSGEVSQTDKVRISVPGIRDKERLMTIARSLYEEIGRGELGGSCKTGVLASYKGDYRDPDMLTLRPGDAIEVIVDARQLSSNAPNVATLTDSVRRSFGEQVEEVKRALSGKAGGGDENLARIIVASSRSMIVDLLRMFRVANVVFNWAQSSVQVAFDFQNYFVIRHDLNKQLGENTTPKVVKVVTSNTAKRPKSRPTNTKPKPADWKLSPEHREWWKTGQ